MLIIDSDRLSICGQLSVNYSFDVDFFFSQKNSRNRIKPENVAKWRWCDTWRIGGGDWMRALADASATAADSSNENQLNSIFKKIKQDEIKSPTFSTLTLIRAEKNRTNKNIFVVVLFLSVCFKFNQLSSIDKN